MSRSEKLIAFFVALLIIIGGILGFWANSANLPAAAINQTEKYDGDCTGKETAGRCADKPFDHSNCQYPDRWSNPADGCDNSDPAVPECIKEFSTQQGEQACIAAYVDHQKELVENLTPAPSEAEFEGK